VDSLDKSPPQDGVCNVSCYVMRDSYLDDLVVSVLFAVIIPEFSDSQLPQKIAFPVKDFVMWLMWQYDKRRARHTETAVTEHEWWSFQAAHTDEWSELQEIIDFLVHDVSPKLGSRSLIDKPSFVDKRDMYPATVRQWVRPTASTRSAKPCFDNWGQMAQCKENSDVGFRVGMHLICKRYFVILSTLCHGTRDVALQRRLADEFVPHTLLGLWKTEMEVTLTLPWRISWVLLKAVDERSSVADNRTAVVVGNDDISAYQTLLDKVVSTGVV
jgi:hypothetical protein